MKAKIKKDEYYNKRGITLITLPIWEDVQAGKEVSTGFSYDLTAPKEEGQYTLYEKVYEDNTHAGWMWVKQ